MKSSMVWKSADLHGLHYCQLPRSPRKGGSRHSCGSRAEAIAACQFQTREVVGSDVLDLQCDMFDELRTGQHLRDMLLAVVCT